MVNASGSWEASLKFISELFTKIKLVDETQENAIKRIASVLQECFRADLTGIIVYDQQTYFIEKNKGAVPSEQIIVNRNKVISKTVEDICSQGRMVVSNNIDDFPLSMSLRNHKVTRLIASPIGRDNLEGILYIINPDNRILGIFRREEYDRANTILVELGKFLSVVLGNFVKVKKDQWDLRELKADKEKEVIQKALRTFEGKTKIEIAQKLGITRDALLKKCKKYGIK